MILELGDERKACEGPGVGEGRVREGASLLREGVMRGREGEHRVMK